MILFKINSQTLSKNPSTMKNGKTKIQKSDRTMDGTLVVDIIAYKDTVTFTWDFLSNDDLKVLINEITAKALCTIEYKDVKLTTDSSELKTIVAQPGDISYAPHYDYATDSIIWKSVSLTFTER
ncbi:MAG: hypothetical protein IJ371_04190 [Clostridia bacterium]|nr:hypothetical protein [Clostridia bacterium]